MRTRGDGLGWERDEEGGGAGEGCYINRRLPSARKHASDSTRLDSTASQSADPGHAPLVHRDAMTTESTPLPHYSISGNPIRADPFPFAAAEAGP